MKKMINWNTPHRYTFFITYNYDIDSVVNLEIINNYTGWREYLEKKLASRGDESDVLETQSFNNYRKIFFRRKNWPKIT